MDKEVFTAQKHEITEHEIYKTLAKKDKLNKKILEEIAKEELKHYKILKGITQQDVKPKKTKVVFYELLSLFFGIAFSLKLMEKLERKSIERYKKIARKYKVAKKILKDELKHEKKLSERLKDERLDFLGSIVLGLNDALVELTGALAGLTFALENTLIIAVAGIITGFSASLSMAASQYLAKNVEKEKRARRAALYTGLAYIITVILLVLPFLILKVAEIALAMTVMIAITIISFFSFFVSVVHDRPFKKEVGRMLFISMGVTFLSFVLGITIRAYLGI